MTTTTVFAGTNDGWITSTDAVYATVLAGAALSADTAGTTMYVGQIPGYEEHELFIDFVTSAISPEVVSAVVLSLWHYEDQSITNFLNECLVFNWGGTVTTADWRTPTQLNALTIVATFDTTGQVAGVTDTTYVAFTDNGNFPAAIVTAGTTSLMVASNRTRGSNDPGGTGEYNAFRTADNTGTTNDPKLVITSAVAAGQPTGRRMGGVQFNAFSPGNLVRRW